MNYELKLEQFSGPLDKLLELIEEKKLEITQLSLAQVTADFLTYLQSLPPTADKNILADFLVIASRLILIKSQALFPFLSLAEEEKTEIAALEKQLKIYQELKSAQKNIVFLWKDEPQMMNREFLKSFQTFFYPPQKLKVGDLEKTIERLFGDWEKIFIPQAPVVNHFISLEKTMAEVLKKISEKPLDFSSLKKEGSKSEIIVLFLAILYLIKNQVIEVHQKYFFSEIKIAKKINSAKIEKDD